MPKRKHNQAWYKEEKEVVLDLIKLGYRARRQPGSGNKAVDLQHDCVWHDSPIGKLHIECKFKSKATWKTCENDRDGADILTMRESHGKRMVYMDWATFLQLVGSAADRSEIAADLPKAGCPECHKYAGHCPVCHNRLPSVEPDKPWLTEVERNPPPPVTDWDAIAERFGLEEAWRRRDRINAAHQNPPPRKPKPNKLKGRGFGK